MILVNTFEEPFGDESGKGVWNELSETVSSNIHGNIAALASFNGNFVVLCYYLYVLLPLLLFGHN
jgi:hypothetical protein